MKRTRFALSAFLGTFTAAAQIVGLSYGGRPAAKEFAPIPVRCVCPQELAQLRAESARLAAGLMMPATRGVMDQWAAGVTPAAPEKVASQFDAFGYQEKRAAYGYNILADLTAKFQPASVSLAPLRDEVAPSWSPLEEKVGDIFDYLPKSSAAASQAQPAAAQPASSRRQDAVAPMAGYSLWRGYDGFGYPYVDHSLKRGPVHAVAPPIGGGGMLGARGPLGGTGMLGAAAGPIGSQSALGNNAPLGAGGPLSSSGPLSSQGIISGVGPLTGTGPLSGIGIISGSGNLNGSGNLTGQGMLNGGGILGGGGGPLGGGSTAPLGDGAGPLKRDAAPQPLANDKLKNDLADLVRYMGYVASLDEAMRINLANDGIHSRQCPIVDRPAPKAAAAFEPEYCDLADFGETCPGQVLDVDADDADADICPLAAEADPFLEDGDASQTATDPVDYEYDDTYGIYDEDYTDFQVSTPAAPATEADAVEAGQAEDAVEDAAEEGSADASAEAAAEEAADEDAAYPRCRDEAWHYRSGRYNSYPNHCPYSGAYIGECYDSEFAAADAPVAAAPAPTADSDSAAAADDAAEAEGPVEAPPMETAPAEASQNFTSLDAAYEEYGLYDYDGYDDYGYGAYDVEPADDKCNYVDDAAAAEGACEGADYCDEADLNYDDAEFIDDCISDEAGLNDDGANANDQALLHGPEYDCFGERLAVEEAPVAAPAPGPEYYEAVNMAAAEATLEALENLVVFIQGMQEELHALAAELGEVQINFQDPAAALTADTERAVDVEKADFAPAAGNQYGPALPSADEQLRPMPRDLPSFMFPAEFDLGI